MIFSRWWFWVLILLLFIFLALLIWWLLRRRAGGQAARPAEPEIPLRPHALEQPAPAAVETPAAAPSLAPKPDDLTIIEGIGPKISGILQAAGITTFAQLAATDAGRVTQILQDAGIRLADPTTWAEQARLAAEDDWIGLEALQSRLKGGRQV